MLPLSMTSIKSKKDKHETLWNSSNTNQLFWWKVGFMLLHNLIMKEEVASKYLIILTYEANVWLLNNLLKWVQDWNEVTYQNQIKGLSTHKRCKWDGLRNIKKVAMAASLQLVMHQVASNEFSFRHLKRYSKKWSLINIIIIIEASSHLAVDGLVGSPFSPQSYLQPFFY